MVLKNKIDFLGIIVAEKCNPNGDPMNGNRPRQDLSTGCGEITPECIKRKIRNRLQDMGENIFVQIRGRTDDGFRSQKERIEAFKKSHKAKSHDELYRLVCQEWIDARSFGLIIPYKNNEGITLGIRGPVSIGYATSIEPINISDILITKSENQETEENNKKDSSTIGVKHIIDKGVYVFSGGIYPDLAKKTGFSDEDAEKIKNAIITLFENDCSNARPSGSMSLVKLYWWKHPGSCSSCPPVKLIKSVKIEPQKEWPYFKDSCSKIGSVDTKIYSFI